MKSFGHEDPSILEVVGLAVNTPYVRGKDAHDTSTEADRSRISFAEAEALRGEHTAYLAQFTHDEERFIKYNSYRHKSYEWYGSSTHDEDGYSGTIRVSTLPEDGAEHYRGMIVSGIRGLADGSLRGHDLSRFSVMLDTIADGFYDTDGEHVSVEGPTKLFDATVAVANDLTHAIALQEHNLPPNHLGLTHDGHASLGNMTREVGKSLENAVRGTDGNSWELEEGILPLFGDVTETVTTINAVLERAEELHPTLFGAPVACDYPKPLGVPGTSPKE